MTDQSMAYQPQPRTIPAPAAPAAVEPDLYEVPLLPQRTITALIGGRRVIFNRPKQAGMKIIAQHGRSLMAAAQASVNNEQTVELDPALIELQFQAFDEAETVLRGLVPFMVADKDQRAWVLSCFDHPEIDTTQLVVVLLRIFSDLAATPAPPAHTDQEDAVDEAAPVDEAASAAAA